MTRESHERFYILRHRSRLIPECAGISVMRKDFNKNSFTRAEAVERVSEAIAKDQWKRLATQNDTFEAFFKRHKLAFDNSAQAALDALINSQDNDHVDDQKRITDGD